MFRAVSAGSCTAALVSEDGTGVYSFLLEQIIGERKCRAEQLAASRGAIFWKWRGGGQNQISFRDQILDRL
jgi:CII-binding regulator of phage lambda lysogenization HflD